MGAALRDEDGVVHWTPHDDDTMRWARDAWAHGSSWTVWVVCDEELDQSTVYPPRKFLSGRDLGARLGAVTCLACAARLPRWERRIP